MWPDPRRTDDANADRITTGPNRLRQRGPPAVTSSRRCPSRCPPERHQLPNVACGNNGTATVCNNNYDGGGFVISPAGSFVIEPNNPLLTNDGGGRNPVLQLNGLEVVAVGQRRLEAARLTWWPAPWW